MVYHGNNIDFIHWTIVKYGFSKKILHLKNYL